MNIGPLQRFLYVEPDITSQAIVLFGRKKGESVKKDQKSITELVRKSLEIAEIKYNYSSKDNCFICHFMGDDLPITMSISIDEISIRFICYLDLKAKEEKYREVTWELNDINRSLIFGAFFLDPDDGMISFEYSFPYIEAEVSHGFILSFMKMLADTVDRNDADLKKLAESVTHSDSGKNAMYR